MEVMSISSTASDTLALLTLLAKLGPSTIDELAQAAHTNLDTCKRRLDTLESRGFVVKRSDGTWGLGPKLIHLASVVPDRLTIVSRHTVNHLAEQFEASVVVAVADPPNFLIKLERDGHGGSVTVEHLSGVEFGMWEGAPGLALLDSLTEEQFAQVLGASDQPDEVFRARDQLVREGLVIAESLVITGYTGIAIPLELRNQSTIGSLTLAFADIRRADISEARRELVEAAKTITQRYEQMTDARRFAVATHRATVRS